MVVAILTAISVIVNLVIVGIAITIGVVIISLVLTVFAIALAVAGSSPSGTDLLFVRGNIRVAAKQFKRVRYCMNHTT